MRQDIGKAGKAAAPGTVILTLFLLVRPHFVEQGWPLFAILWLGLFAGILSIIGPTNDDRR